MEHPVCSMCDGFTQFDSIDSAQNMKKSCIHTIISKANFFIYLKYYFLKVNFRLSGNYSDICSENWTFFSDFRAL